MEELNRNEKITIGTTPIVISKDKENSKSMRVNIIVINTSTGGQTITLAVNEEAKDGEGITLGVGGVWSDSSETGYKATQKLITGISDLADGTIAIQERGLQ